MIYLKQGALFFTIAFATGVQSQEVSFLLNGQAAFATETNRGQQQELLLDAEYNRSLWGGDVTAIGRLRFDALSRLNAQHYERPDTYSSVGGPFVSGPKGQVGLREFYWQRDGNAFFVRIGKQQVVWGEADGLKVLDVVNPQSFREFILDDFDDSRIPLWMVNLERPVGDNGALQLLWVPDTSTHELPPEDSPFAFTSPVLVPTPPVGIPVDIVEPQAPSGGLKDGDIGGRFTQFIGGWDLSFNYLYHYVDTPVVRTRLTNNRIIVEQEYERSHLTGLAASTAFGDWTLRLEAAYETDRYHRITTIDSVEKADQWSSVIGIDWQGWSDQFVSLQWFQTTITDRIPSLVNHRQEDTVTALWQVDFLNQTLTAEALVIHSIDHGDGVAQLELKYNYQTGLDLYIGADIFYGDSDQLYGQFRQVDRLLVGFEWGF